MGGQRRRLPTRGDPADEVHSASVAAHPMAAPRAEVSRPSVRVPYERKVVRKNNRGGTANVARGPTGPPRSVIAPPAVSAPAERRPRSLCSAAARSADFFWPHGNSARAPPSRSLPAGVACTLLGRVNPAAGGRGGAPARTPRCPSRNLRSRGRLRRGLIRDGPAGGATSPGVFAALWSSFSLNGNMPPGARRGRLGQPGDAFGSFGAIRFPAAGAIELHAGNRTAATLPTGRAARSVHHDRRCVRSEGRVGQRRATPATVDAATSIRWFARRDASAICPIGERERGRLANDGGGAPDAALRPGVSRPWVRPPYRRPSAPGK